jgi:hypothetical protein
VKRMISWTRQHRDIVGDRYPLSPYKHRNTISTCLNQTLGGSCSSDSPEASFGWETRFYLARGQPRTGDTVSSCPRSTLGERCRSVSPEASSGQETKLCLARRQQLWAGDTVPSRSRLALGGRCSFVSPEANLGRDM